MRNQLVVFRDFIQISITRLTGFYAKQIHTYLTFYKEISRIIFNSKIETDIHLLIIDDR